MAVHYNSYLLAPWAADLLTWQVQPWVWMLIREKRVEESFYFVQLTKNKIPKRCRLSICNHCLPFCSFPLDLCLTGGRVGWSSTVQLVSCAYFHSHFCLLKCLASTHPERCLNVAQSFCQGYKQFLSDLVSQSLNPDWLLSLCNLDLL